MAYAHLARRMSAAVLMAALAAGPALAQQVPATRGEIALSFSGVVKVAAPSVVSIYATKVVERRVSPFAGDPMFERLFRDFGATRPEVQNSLGSGVIVGVEGLVVSNYHVVEGAQEITVLLQDRRQLRARVVLADQDNDLAVLRLEGAEGLPAITLRDSDEVEVGDLVLAIGNPFGLDQTVSMGIISALSRSAISVGDGRGYFLQTDAAINPGNSGGALVDHQGRLVGINTAILSQSGGSNGVGFAIPSNLVRAVVAQAAEGKDRFMRPWAGVTGQAVDGTLSESLGLSHPEGVLISGLHPASPFAAAGLRSGDLVRSLQGHVVNGPAEMIYRMSELGIGERAKVVYRRGGQDLEAEVEMILPPDSPARDPRRLGRDAGPLQGLEVVRLNPLVQEEMKLQVTLPGAVVVSAVAGWAAEAGLRPRDLLVAINGREVSSPEAAEQAAQAEAGRGTRSWAVSVVREGRPITLRFRT
ncbi:trypsin-like peptidase domain-containing protein [Falsigemmobacter faecalis]|uniref:PDZ domain-containing protein n=1 Tax=Falsigemmobacter faecalis TaxID=2488730 RepID=A0A3P3D8S7_9RHOB|nr:trypsin-like peptidase domain-containing protein [Falsigemmobacter faecalis]RRH70224.1 PDZ domain-containing protein [Falsigemmobacter faecalis]